METRDSKGWQKVDEDSSGRDEQGRTYETMGERYR